MDKTIKYDWLNAKTRQSCPCQRQLCDNSNFVYPDNAAIRFLIIWYVFDKHVKKYGTVTRVETGASVEGNKNTRWHWWFLLSTPAPVSTLISYPSSLIHVFYIPPPQKKLIWNFFHI